MVVQANRVIYRLVEAAAEHIQRTVPPRRTEVRLGAATVREVFEINGGQGAVAGCRVSDGEIVRGPDTVARVERKGMGVIFGGSAGVPLSSLRVRKEAAERVSEGDECGL